MCSTLILDIQCASTMSPIKRAQSYCNLQFLFSHQLQPKYRFAHHWAEGDVLMWENIGTLHYAAADYRENEHRLVKRCQVMADLVFSEVRTEFKPDPDARGSL